MQGPTIGLVHPAWYGLAPEGCQGCCPSPTQLGSITTGLQMENDRGGGWARFATCFSMKGYGCIDLRPTTPSISPKTPLAGGFMLTPIGLDADLHSREPEARADTTHLRGRFLKTSSEWVMRFWWSALRWM